MGDRKPSVSEAPQEPRPRRARRLPPHHLIQPPTLQYSGYFLRPARGQLGRRRPQCGPHLRGRIPAGASERWSTHREHRTLQGIENLFRHVAALSSEEDRLRTSSRDPHLCSRKPCSNSRDPRPGSRNRRQSSRFPTQGDTAPTSCWYHRRCGARAQKCTPPYAYRQQRKPTQQISSAAHVCSTKTGGLFITDRLGRWQLLADAGFDICVYPRRLIPRRRERANYDLCAANGTTIQAYEWLPLTAST
jgi:hypothetical protein